MQSVKIAYGGELRRFAFEGDSFNHLEDLIKATFGITGAIRVRYVDNEGDKITISSDAEIKTARGLCAENALRLEITSESVKNAGVSCPTIAPTSEPSAEGERSPGTFYKKKYLEKLEKKHEKRDKKGEKKVKKTLENEKKEKKHGEVRFVEHVSIPMGTSLSSNEDFTKSWKIRNESENAWKNCFLIFKKGERMTSSTRFPLADVEPGQEVTISVPMKTPSEPGTYRSVWSVCSADGTLFGRPLLAMIKVPTLTDKSPSQWNGAVAELVRMGFTNEELNSRLLYKFRGDVDKAVWKLLKLQQKECDCKEKKKKTRKADFIC